jgi:NhaP-type Na+/H+ or K+/H+ antiporter
MKALPQLLILAFPMVLTGTVLIALVAHYALPYGWPMSLTATLGAILSSTDPVAVGSVLKSAGATPRLQMHISGESLLNDGSAVVFFFIFSTMFLAENGVGDTIDWGEGCVIFVRMVFGGTAVGLVFATALLLILYELDRRLEPEYNVRFFPVLMLPHIILAL